MSPQTQVVLANGIYLKADWKNPFDINDTQESDFTLSNGKKVRTKLMKILSPAAAKYATFKNEGFSLIEQPYVDDSISMVVIAPNRYDGLPAIEASLNSATVSRWISKLKSQPVNVYMLCYKIDSAYQLNDTLQAMGLVSAFRSPAADNSADFSGMTANTSAAEEFLSIWLPIRL